ncbi:MAG TPA: ATP-binding protein [Chthoniobacterales bacterium]|jgi:anti-sigma regulatory factor (Ser/Thr protein kinase)
MPGLTLEIGNDFSALRPASGALREFLTERGAPEAASFLADLVLEELVTNTIKYGYDDAGAHCIHVDVDFAAGRLGIAVRDDGRPFDPLDRPAPDVTLPADQRDIGGLGLHLVRQMTDSLTYERRDGWNIVRAEKDFPSA